MGRSGVGNVGPGPQEGLPGDDDDPLVLRPRGVVGELAVEFRSGLPPNDGEVAVLEFENVRAGLAGLASSLPWSSTDAAHDFQMDPGPWNV